MISRSLLFVGTLRPVSISKSLVIAVLGFTSLAMVSFCPNAIAAEIEFTPVQTDTFSDPLGQSNAWGDYDNDGDLDLVVVFLNEPIRLYENRGAEGFIDVGPDVNLITNPGNARAVAWGDYDGDGDIDLYIAYADGVNPNVLMENQISNHSKPGQKAFVDVGVERGVSFVGATRQLNFVDYDADGDLDLHVALRNATNRLYQNNEGNFSNVARQIGFYEPRRTVGACWFDMDSDGDLDAFTTNQSGDRDGMYRYEDGRFSDVAMALNIDQARRPLIDGGVGCAITDFDSDGDLDLYVAEYGDDSLFRNNGDGTFTDVAVAMGVATHDHIVTGVWGDVNNDGLPDLYVVGYVNGRPGMPDYLYINKGDHFENQLPDNVMANDTDHGVQFADFDQDGDLDLSLAANDPSGSHYLFRNDLAESAGQSIQVMVLNEDGHQVMAGSEVRVFVAGSDKLLGSRLVDTGSGYNSQNSKPVHVATPGIQTVDVEVTTMSANGRRQTYFRGIHIRSLSNKPFQARVPR